MGYRVAGGPRLQPTTATPPAIAHPAHFRPDIEGLRAFAILPILAFHFGMPGVGGGFVGVDVFFVISGYLLTAILLRGAAEAGFSLAEFYRRRIVRILPALLVMLAIVLAAGPILLLPQELAALGHSAAATAAMAANVWFWTQVGYFAPLADGELLLHSWSLGVEEQFYLLYPLLLLAAWRRPALLLALLGGASFALACWWTAKDYPAAFYLLPARAWQLALGGLAATGAVRIVGQRAAAAWFGLILILASVAAAGELRPLPVPAGTLATIGAFLLILSGPGTGAGWLLAHPALRAVGARSYSLYLWHWPVVTFWRLGHGSTLSVPAALGLGAATFALAELSYRLIERPGIAWGRRGRPWPKLVMGLAVMLAVAGAALVVARYQRPLSPAVAKVAAYAGYDATPERRFQFRTGSCFLEGGGAPAPECIALDPARPNWALIGDSHGAMLWRALAERYPNVNLLQFTAPGCRPLPDAPGKPACIRPRAAAYAAVAGDPRIERVILAGRWQASDVPRLAAAVAALRRTGRPVTVIGPVVEYDGAFPALLARAMLAGEAGRFDRFRLVARAALDAKIGAVARGAGADYRSLYRAECPDRCALATGEGVPLHSDYGHLTLAGSRLVAGRMALIE